jgi:hypothetical protein
MDYIKHLIANKLGLVATASLTFLFGALFTLNITAIYAQPASAPPNGNVNASFNSISVSGITTLDGSILSNSGAVTFDDMVSINGRLSLTGWISNQSTSYNGAVAIIDQEGVDVRGPIQNNLETSTPGSTFPLSIADDVEITRNLTVSGSIKTSSATALGSFYTVDRSISVTTPATNSVNITCPKGVILSCNGYKNVRTGTSTVISSALIPTVVSSTGNSCTLINAAGANAGLYATARCFDATGTQGDIDLAS